MKYTTSETIGRKLHQYRIISKLTIQDVSDYNFISSPTLTNIESGRVQVKMIVFEELCKLYGCKSSDILPF